MSSLVDLTDVDRWFDDYLAAFAACGRGEGEPSSLLAHYGVPLLVTTDDGVLTLTDTDQVVALVQSQVDGMRAAGYHDSAVLDRDISPLNAVSALYRGTFSRRRRDGSEIGRLSATYMVTGTAETRRIAALAVHS